MVFKKSDVSTILVVSNNGEKTKTLQVKTRHLKSLKYYIGGLCLVIAALTLTIIVLVSDLNSYTSEKTVLSHRISQLQKQVPKPSDTLKAINYVQSIEEKLKKINESLLKRGIRGFAKEAVGGNSDAGAKLSPQETYAFYDLRLKNILTGISYTPIGYSAAAPVVTSVFGYRSDPFKSGHAEFHPGIDFKGSKGDKVKSTAAGLVVVAGPSAGYGNCVRIKHMNGLETLYGHLSRVGVSVGDKVTAGQVIGYMGSTGRSTGTHLHYEIRKDGKPINPVNFLKLN